VGAALLATALAGYGLILIDQQMGTLHLSPSEIRALRSPATGPATGLTMPWAATPTAASSAQGNTSAPSSSDAAGPDAAHTKLLPADPTPDQPTPAAQDQPSDPAAFNYVAPPAYLAQAAAAATSDRRFVIRRILPINGPIRYGEWHWDEAGVPPGPLVVTVDLQARVISVFRAGYEIGTAAVLLGTGEFPTPTGVFPISQKDEHHISNIYDAPMPYMLRLTQDGVTIHGSNVRNGFASHGCIGVPIDFAKLLFEHAHLGDRVYITRGKQVGLGDVLVDR